MALRECPECDKAVSTDAKACPYCGCPLDGGKKRRSYLWPLLLILFMLGAIGVALDKPSTKFGDGFKGDTIPAARCNASQADALMDKFIRAGVIHRLDLKSQVPTIYVLEAWHHLTIDDKRTLDNAIQCHLMRGIGKAVLAVYHDGRTDKEVAETGPYGFEMK